MTQIFEEDGFSVQRHTTTGVHTVFRPARSGTHAESDSAYPAGLDGAGLAVARALYLARGPGMHAREAVRIAAETAPLGGHIRAAIEESDARDATPYPEPTR